MRIKFRTAVNVGSHHQSEQQGGAGQEVYEVQFSILISMYTSIFTKLISLLAIGTGTWFQEVLLTKRLIRDDFQVNRQCLNVLL